MQTCYRDYRHRSLHLMPSVTLATARHGPGHGYSDKADPRKWDRDGSCRSQCTLTEQQHQKAGAGLHLSPLHQEPSLCDYLPSVQMWTGCGRRGQLGGLLGLWRINANLYLSIFLAENCEKYFQQWDSQVLQAAVQVTHLAS